MARLATDFAHPKTYQGSHGYNDQGGFGVLEKTAAEKVSKYVPAVISVLVTLFIVAF